MSARLDTEVMQHLVRMHRELLLREGARNTGDESPPFTVDNFEEDFADEEILQPRRLFLRVF